MIVTCHKCGSLIPVNSHEDLRWILHKIHRLEDQMTGARTRQRQTLVQKISTLRTVYRQTNHTITELEKARTETPVLYADLRDYVLQRGLMDQNELDQLTEKSRGRAALKRQQLEEEAKRLIMAARKEVQTHEV